jgi:murein peptide amidase A
MRDIFDWPAFLPEFSRAAAAAGFTPHTLLETEDGAIMAWERAGDGAPIYLSAGIHGDEPAGPLAALELMDGDFFPQGRHCIVCPALNPGGLAAVSRTNRLGVDLNRDYLHMSSPEAAAHANWLDSRPVPGLFVSLHEDWETDGFYFYEINLGEDDANRASELLAAVSPYFPAERGPEIDGHTARAAGWIFHRAEADLPGSWPEAIWLAKRGCPLSFTFETPSKAELSARVAAHVACVRTMFRLDACVPKKKG